MFKCFMHHIKIVRVAFKASFKVPCYHPLKCRQRDLKSIPSNLQIVVQSFASGKLDVMITFLLSTLSDAFQCEKEA